MLSIRYAAGIDRAANANADMVVQFRKTLRSDPSCPNETVFGPGDTWFTLDADTGSGFFSQSSNAARPFNTVTLRDAFGTEQFIATCFQYRVRFIQNGLDTNQIPVAAANPSVSPKLFSMNIEKVVAGNADIRITENGFDAKTLNGRLTTFDTVIRNLSLEGRDNTQDAGLEDDGSFYVHLCVAYAPPGQPAPTLTVPELPLASGAPNPECFQAYYEVYKWQMRAGETLSLVNRGIDNGTQQTWRRQTSPTTEEAISDIRTLFSQPGTYRVAMVIDARNFVPEGTAGETNNRVEDINNGQPKILTLEITGSPINVINLPIIHQ